MRQRLLTQHHSFLLAWVFLRDCHWLFNCRVQRYSVGQCHATPEPDSSQMLITILQEWHCFSQNTVLAGLLSHSHIVSLAVGSFFGDSGYKSQWHADGYLAEVPKQTSARDCCRSCCWRGREGAHVACWGHMSGAQPAVRLVKVRYESLHSRYWHSITTV